MEFKNINSYTSAYKYAEKRGGVPKVPFAIFWEFFPEDEKRLVDVARQVQHTFNLVQSTEPFKIEEVEKIEEDLFDIEINPGGLIPFKIDQDSFEQQQTAQQIDKQLDAHQKKKEEQKTPEKKVRKTSDELYNEFKSREEKILVEIREESLAKAKEEAAETLAKAKAEVEVKAAKAEEALVEALAEAKKALAEALAEAKAETEAAKAEAKTAKVETKVEAKATTLKLFGYTVFEFSK